MIWFDGWLRNFWSNAMLFMSHNSGNLMHWVPWVYVLYIAQLEGGGNFRFGRKNTIPPQLLLTTPNYFYKEN